MFAVLSIGLLGFGVLQSLVLPILPTVQREFGSTQHEVTWVLTAYLLSASVATPIVGRIGDTVGKNKVLVLTLLTLALGCVLAALAPNLGVLIAARALQGIGGGVLPLSFGILRDEFPAPKLPGAIGAASGLMALGGGLGVLVAGPIVAWLDFRWLFWFAAIAVAPAALAAALWVPTSPVRDRSRINVGSALLLSSGLTALLLGISQGPVLQWWSVPTVGLFTGALLLLTGWVLVELRTDSPLVDLRMVMVPAVRTTNLAALLFGIGQFTIVGFLPTFVQAPTSTGYGFGSDLTQAALFLLPQTTMMALTGLLAGQFVRVLGLRGTLVAGLILTVAAYLEFALLADHPWQVFTGSALLGAGMGLSVAAMAGVVVSAVPANRTGVASGLTANLRTIGGAIGATVMSSIVAGSTVGEQPSAGQWRAGFLFLAASALLAVVAALLIPRETPRSRVTARSSHLTRTEPSR